MTRHFLYPRHLHNLKTVSFGVEEIQSAEQQNFIYVVDGMIAAYINKTDMTFYFLELYDLECLNILLKYCGVDKHFENILEI